MDESNMDRWLGAIFASLLIVFLILGFPSGTGFWNGSLFVLLVLSLAGWGFTGIKNLDVGFKAQLLFLGERKLVFFGEGKRWVPFPFDLKKEDCRTTIIKLDLAKAFCQDNVEIEMEASIARQIINLDQFFGVNPSELKQWLDDLRDQLFRQQASKRGLREALAMSGEVKKEFKEALGERGGEWGIQITDVVIARITPTNTKVLEDLALTERENLQQAGQLKEAETISKLIEVLRKKQSGGKEMSEELAHQTALLIADKAEKKKLVNLGLDPATAEVVLAILARRN